MRKPRATFQLSDEWIERAILMVRRAEITQPCVWLALDPHRQGRGQPRLADPRLARDQHYSAFARVRLLPAAQQQVELFVAPDQGCGLGAQGLKATEDLAFAEDAPGALRLSKAGERLRPEILDREQRADLPPGAVGDDQRAGGRQRLQPGGEVRRFADDAP